jgi:hypothetical protein
MKASDIEELSLFEVNLYQKYKYLQRNSEPYFWISLHKIMKLIDMSEDLFVIRLQQLWSDQFTPEPVFKHKYMFGLEVDTTPREHYWYRNHQIIIDGVPRYIINMVPRLL